jgi:hypothetical protein
MSCRDREADKNAQVRRKRCEISELEFDQRPLGYACLKTNAQPC